MPDRPPVQGSGRAGDEGDTPDDLDGQAVEALFSASFEIVIDHDGTMAPATNADLGSKTK